MDDYTWRMRLAARHKRIIGGTILDSDNGEGTDIHAANHGFVSVTPLHCDPADYDALVALRKIFRS